ncbi:replication initiation negative regulator SeqA [Utexia brackfieldae]|uniref:replication initiation negative regulator SeqA n=1 Tax=Utexia brackfieldae TaxID=3074108 RepID=UPI00370D7045
MKTIEIDDELYQYIASQTLHIGESASSILRRLLTQDELNDANVPVISKRARANTERTDLVELSQVVQSDAFRLEKKSVNRFLAILAALYSFNSSRFTLAAASLHGSKRRYLATSEGALIEHGNNTKPKEINGTSYWVVTNNNTARKRYIIEAIMKNMAIEQNLIDLVTAAFMTKPEVKK